jgi:hypothetical protein
MATNMNEEEIVEKPPYNPLASSCLVLACVAMIGALIFQIAELSDLRAEMSESVKMADKPYEVFANKLIRDFKNDAQQVITENDHPEVEVDMPAGNEPSGGEPPEVPGEENKAPAPGEPGQ